jgi:hypothetical protein
MRFVIAVLVKLGWAGWVLWGSEEKSDFFWYLWSWEWMDDELHFIAVILIILWDDARSFYVILDGMSGDVWALFRVRLVGQGGAE